MTGFLYSCVTENGGGCFAGRFTRNFSLQQSLRISPFKHNTLSKGCFCMLDNFNGRHSALMKKLLTSPQDFNDHIRHHSGAIIMQVRGPIIVCIRYSITSRQLVYGIAVVSKNDPYIEMAEEALSGLVEAAGSGAFLVDVLPICVFILPIHSAVIPLTV